MNKLISNTEFGDYLESIGVSNSCYRMMRKLFDKFLKQTLALWMFVPCKLVGGVWVVLEEPCISCADNCNFDKCLEYQEAKDRCIFFEGFVWRDKSIWLWDGFNHRIIYTENTGFEMPTIEYLVKHNLTLTASAKKQIGL